MARGQITIQLTWVFAIIAGIGVLAFLLMLLAGESDDAELIASVESLAAFETKLKAAARAENTFTKITTPSMGFSILCETPPSSALVSPGAEAARPIPHVPVFSPGELEGREFLTLTKNWGMTGESFLYLTMPDTLLVIFDSDTGRNLSETLPDDIPHHLVPLGHATLGRAGFEKYRFVDFRSSLPGGSPFGFARNELGGDAEVSAVVIDESDREILFYELEQGAAGEWRSMGGVNYTDEAALLAGIFSGNPEAYVCNLGKAVEHMAMQTEINLLRAQLFESEIQDSQAAGNNEPCLSAVSEYKEAYQDLNNTLAADSMAIAGNLRAVEAAYDKVLDIALDLEKGRRCPAP